jgi:uncharacterized repeat protein (TIGR01451 family)
MKRGLHFAGLAVLGLSVAGFVTYIWGQGPSAGTPPTSNNPVLVIPASNPPKPSASSPITLPSVPSTSLPTLPTQPVLTIPGTSEVSKPTVPAPVEPAKPMSLDAAKAVPSLIIPGTSEPVRPSVPVTVKDQPPMEAGSGNSPTIRIEGDGRTMVHSAGTQPTEDNPTSRQEPAVSLEWIGPPTAKIGNASDYSIVVRNVCNIPVQQVLVRVRLPHGIQVTSTEPRAVQEDNVLMWEFGTLLPKQERNLQLRLVSTHKGDANCQAWVTFTGASVMRIRVREPKLLIKATAPERVLMGDACTFILTVSNPGDHPAELVKIQAQVSDGLESARGNKIQYDIGNLAAGETRSVQVICAAKAGGAQNCEAIVEADGGLKATDKASVNVATPKLNLEIVGPKLRYLDRKAVYTFKVNNPGDAPAMNVQISEMLPLGFKYVNSDNGGRHDFSTRSVHWFLGEIGPGQSKEVKLECLAINPGEHNHKVTAVASRGLRVEEPFTTKVEGLSAITMEMIDLEDPVEVGTETTYEIRITNTGSKTETDVKIVCTIPEKLQFKSATGPTTHTINGSEVVFQPIPKLAPRADAIYRLTVKAVAPGVVNFKGRLTSAILQDPVTKEEPTRIYADQQ